MSKEELNKLKAGDYVCLKPYDYYYKVLRKRKTVFILVNLTVSTPTIAVLHDELLSYQVVKPEDVIVKLQTILNINFTGKVRNTSLLGASGKHFSISEVRDNSIYAILPYGCLPDTLSALVKEITNRVSDMEEINNELNIEL